MENKINWWMVVALVALALLLFSSFSIGGFGCGSYGSGYSGGMMSWIFGYNSNYVFTPFMILGMIIAWGIAIIILVVFIKWIIVALGNSQVQVRKRGEHGRRN